MELTQREPWRQHLYRARRRCKVDYAHKNISCTLTVEQIKKLWGRDKAYNLEKRSLDRIDNSKGYSYDNCQFIELSENVIKDTNNPAKPMKQLTRDGELVKTYKGLCEAYRSTKINKYNIWACAKGRRPTAGGFRWEYC